MNSVVEIRYYVTRAGVNAVDHWIRGLKDEPSEARIYARIERLRRGNPGDSKSLGGGLFELRIHAGPGYRTYYAMIGKACVLLLCGGDKRRQSADIQRAREYLIDYRERTQTA
jgi:putative addiction module killer protein